MSNYSSFNLWVYDYYINNCIPHQPNSLSIPSSEIDNFIIENNIRLDKFPEINNYSWSKLLKEKNGIPQYFGLLALQCLAAYMMENSDGKTVANFKNRFVELIGLEKYNDLNSLFSEDYDRKYKIQEKIWYRAKSFFETKNIKIDIPEVTKYAGRYVQFPKSQIILNYEDLKEYVNFFKSIYNEFETISFEDFIKIYLNSISKYRFYFKRINNIKNESEWSKIELKIKIKQIFDFYCSEEWMDIYQDSNLNYQTSNKIFILKINQDGLKLYDEYYNCLSNLSSLIEKNGYMIFKRNNDYPNEYESVNSFSLSEDNLLVIYKSISNTNKIQILDKLFSSINFTDTNSNILIYKITTTDNLPDFLKNKLISSYPIELKGFKVSGKKKYFVNYPPEIKCLKDDIFYQIFFEKKRIENKELNKVGKYTLKINGFSNYNFELIDAPFLEYISNSKIQPLIFKSLNRNNDENGSIDGLHVDYENNSKLESLTINNWIYTLGGKKIETENQILKSIIQSKYGKY